MAEASDEIMNHIEAQRAQLSRNVSELQDRVLDAVDWRSQFDRHPWAFVGAAVFGGYVLAGLLPRFRSPRC